MIIQGLKEKTIRLTKSFSMLLKCVWYRGFSVKKKQ